MRKHYFKPAWWLRNPHMQTIYAKYAGSKRAVYTRKEIFELSDGDFLDCRWTGGDVGPIVVILHGLEGSSDSHYAKGMLQAAQMNGWRAVVVHFRSCGEEMNRLPRGYHSGDTADVHEFMMQLKAKEPHTPIMAIGYSMGGNVLLKWLGEVGSECPLMAAVAVSVPFELHIASNRVQHGLARWYQEYFLKPLRDKLLFKIQAHHLEIDPGAVKAVRSILEFDEYFTAPLHGFENAMDYYMKSSSRYFMHNIQVPTLVIHAKDDPLMSPSLIPSHDEVSPYVKMEIYDRGGHVGFVSGWNPFNPQYWLEHRIPDYFAEQLRFLRKPWRIA
jgi:hypothetical protein